MKYQPPLEKERPTKDPLPVLEFLACFVTVFFGIGSIPTISNLFLFGCEPFKYFNNILAYVFYIAIYNIISMESDTKRISRYQRYMLTLGAAWLIDRVRDWLGIKGFWTHVKFTSDNISHLQEENIARVDRIYLGKETIDYLYMNDFSNIKKCRLKHKTKVDEEKFEDCSDSLSWIESLRLGSVSGYYWYWNFRKIFHSGKNIKKNCVDFGD